MSPPRQNHATPAALSGFFPWNLRFCDAEAVAAPDFQFGEGVVRGMAVLDHPFFPIEFLHKKMNMCFVGECIIFV